MSGASQPLEASGAPIPQGSAVAGVINLAAGAHTAMAAADCPDGNLGVYSRSSSTVLLLGSWG
ncbi:MAG: hypothetical protein ACJ77Z_15895 [Thermoleophilaceae bacterium]